MVSHLPRSTSALKLPMEFVCWQSHGLLALFCSGHHLSPPAQRLDHFFGGPGVILLDLLAWRITAHLGPYQAIGKHGGDSTGFSSTFSNEDGWTRARRCRHVSVIPDLVRLEWTSVFRGPDRRSPRVLPHPTRQDDPETRETWRSRTFATPRCTRSR